MNQNIEFFYFVNKSESNRVCISKSLYKNVFKFAHDNHVHDDIEKSLNRLRQSIYMSKMKNRLKKYIDECSTCQLFKSFKQLFYEQLHSIEISKEFLFELSMNFVVELSMTSKSYNAFVIVICRYFKYVRLISDKENWTTERWTQKYHKKIYRTWNLFVRIVTNRNFKFINDFWRILFEKNDVKLNFITIYHFSFDEQIERTNQIVETIFRCLLINQYEENWIKILLEIEYALNIVENASISITSFEIFYDVKSRKMLNSFMSSKNNDTSELNFLKKKTITKRNLRRD